MKLLKDAAVQIAKYDPANDANNYFLPRITLYPLRI